NCTWYAAIQPDCRQWPRPFPSHFMSQTFDLIVVGAGPGGSNAAAGALDVGLSVSPVDCYSFSKVKTCAGGMTIKACRSLLIDVEPIVHRVFHSFEFDLFGTRINQFTHPSPVLTMVVRPEFDNFLVEKNSTSKNFTFYDQERVTHVEWD